MHRTLVGVAVLAALTAAPVSAQFYPVQPEPTAWLGLGIGAFNAGHVADGKTGTTWDFGNRMSPQYRLTLERAFRSGMSVGVAGTMVRAPIRYTAEAGALPEVTAVCASSCPADVDVYSLYALFHAGGGAGFHQVVEAALGVTSYRNFRLESDGTRLPPDEERDLAFAFAYGFGYSLSPRTAVNLVQEYGLNFHESRGAPSNASNTLRFTNTRLGLRFGMGGNRPTRPRRR